MQHDKYLIHFSSCITIHTTDHTQLYSLCPVKSRFSPKPEQVSDVNKWTSQKVLPQFCDTMSRSRKRRVLASDVTCTQAYTLSCTLSVSAALLSHWLWDWEAWILLISFSLSLTRSHFWPLYLSLCLSLSLTRCRFSFSDDYVTFTHPRAYGPTTLCFHWQRAAVFKDW